MEAIFEFLFKYRPSLLGAGRLGFAPPVSTEVVLALVLGVAVLVVALYARMRARPPVQRATLGMLRVGAVAVLGFCLLRPQLILSTVVPQQNHVAVLVDDSRSMRIADGGEPRAASVQRALAADGALLAALQQRFQVRQYAFSNATARLGDVADLTFAGERTRLAPALERARTELASLPVSGVVLVSDGGGSDGGELTETLLALRAAGVPVYTVGVGRPEIDRDVELSRAGAPSEVLVGASLSADLIVAQRGYAGEPVDIVVEDEGRIVATEQIELPIDGAPTPVRVAFTAAEPGARRLRFRIAPMDGERIVENNVQEMVLHVRDGREKILYFEGEPRFEVKFMRRAVEDDENLQLVVLQRTAQNKFLRLSVDSAGELAAGFPRTRDELFRYRALVLGSVEASYFTHDQLQMIADFVSERGGGLLMLGGKRSFAEGGWAGTPVADVLPVLLEARDTSYFAEVTVRPTREGTAHAVTRLTADADSTRALWEMLPPLTVFNRIARAKPGATVLLNGGDQIVLAGQRFGRGQAIAFTPHDSWLWQMHAAVPLEDMSHETFWRQMMRWLVDGVPDQVVARMERDRVAPGEGVRITAQVDDERFIGVNNGSVVARVIAPSGAETEVPLGWTLERDGAYAASFAPSEEGLHEIEVRATVGDEAYTSARTFVNAAPSTSEFYEAGMREPLLRRIADETGGRFYALDEIGRLPDDLAVAGHGATIVETRELWDMPVIFLALILLLGGEWLLRRRWGLR